MFVSCFGGFYKDTVFPGKRESFAEKERDLRKIAIFTPETKYENRSAFRYVIQKTIDDEEDL